MFKSYFHNHRREKQPNVTFSHINSHQGPLEVALPYCPTSITGTRCPLPQHDPIMVKGEQIPPDHSRMRSKSQKSGANCFVLLSFTYKKVLHATGCYGSQPHRRWSERQKISFTPIKVGKSAWQVKKNFLMPQCLLFQKLMQINPQIK